MLSMPIFVEQLANFLGLKRNIIAVLLIVLLIGIGEKMTERFLPLYLVTLGGGAFAIGLLNSLNNLLGALYSLPGGYFVELLGYKKALLIFNLITILGYSIVLIFPYWQAVLIGAIFFVSWTTISLPAMMEIVATVLPKNKRTMGVSVNSLIRRIPMALGPVIGGILIGVYGEKEGIYIAFIAALVLAGISLITQQIMIEAPPKKAQLTDSSVWGMALITPRLFKLLISDILIRICEQLPYAFVVIWCVTIHQITPLQFGILTTVEMVTAVVVYLPVAYLADKGTKKPFVVITFTFFSLFPLFLLIAQSFWMMVIAFIMRGLKEFGEPTRKALIMDLAADNRKATTFGTYYLIRDIVVSIVAFGGVLLWDSSTAHLVVNTLGIGQSLLPFFDAVASPETTFLVASGFGMMGTIYFAVFGADSES